MRVFPCAVLPLLCLVGVSQVVLCAEPPVSAWADDAPLVPDKVRQRMQDRDYAMAIQAVEEAVQSTGAPGDYLAYLRGWALYLAKEYDAAIAVLVRLERDFPQSRWVRRARFARALALARKGDFRAAELIYRGEAEYLLSGARRQQLASIYLEFADAAFKPPKEDQKPDYEKALEIYRQALEVGPAPERRLEVELLAAQCHQEMNRWPEAIGLYTHFSKDHPQSPWDIEARFRLGQCQLASGKRQEARRIWQDLLAKYPDSPSPRIPEASFGLAETWRIPSPATAEELSLGVTALESYVRRFPTHKLAGEAHLRIAQSYLHRGRHEDAVAALERFVKDPRWRDRKELPEAWDLLGQTYRTQKKFAEALVTWREFLTRFPTHEAWTSAQKEIVSTEYLMGREQYKAKQYDAALKCLGEFMSKYPLDDRNAAILLLFGQIRAEQQRWEAALADWHRLVAKYPGTDEASRAQLQIAQTLEQPLAKLEEALEAYRKVSGPRADEAQRSIDRLTRAAMSISTERIFRSSEMPRVNLTTRNIESVTVRAYKVDLETYFRKMHAIRGVEQLDIALIDPDRAFDFKVPGYGKYQKIDSSIEVAIPDNGHAGVMAVTVSSKTLEATTLVIQSDLDIILKGSRDEAFVFAENMLTGKPWPSVRLLMSDGKQVIAETIADEQGMSRLASAQLRQSSEVRAFAWCDGHVASNESLLSGSVGQEILDRGYLYTDMPVYRPGGRVHVRGCIRRAVGDLYAAEADKAYTLEALDSRNRVVSQTQVKLSAFGSFHMAFDLPRTSPVGEYRLIARDEKGHSYQDRFRVQEVAQQLVRLTIDAPQRVYHRGELIEGTIRAAWYHGSPIVGREIRFGWQPPSTTHVATTDARGEVRFQLPTREMEETQTLAFTASLPEHNVQTSANFFLSTLGFRIDVRTVRPVFIAGEPFEVTVATRDAEGKPAAEKLHLRVLEQTAAGGDVGERLAEERAMETAADGLAHLTLTLAKGGRFVLRVEGQDRFKNPIAGETAIEISGEEDAARLRILADRQTYRAGDIAEVTLHWREEPALALVTFERGRVLESRLVTLQRGPTQLSIPMTSLLAPNFNLAVAVMHDCRQATPAAKAAEGKPLRRFHVADCLFAVKRELKVSLSCQRADGAAGPLRPGQPVEVTVRTTDLQGTPVIAEVGLAVLPQASVDRSRTQADSLQAFFRGPLRDPSVHTVSSITFACQPTTQPISQRLLSELDRAEIARQEAASRNKPSADAPAGKATTGGSPQHSNTFARGEDPFGGSSATTSHGADRFQDEQSNGRAAGRGIPGVTSAPSPPISSSKATAGAWDSAGFDPSFPAESLDKRFRMESGSPAADLPGGVGAQAAYWNPAVITGPDGKALVRFTLPEQSAAWTLVAKGLTSDALAGEATEGLVVRKPLFGELKLPAAFTEGDEADVPVVITNDLFDQGPIEVSLKMILGGRVTQDRRTLNAKAKGGFETSFKVSLRWPEGSPAGPTQRTVVFELAVSGGGAHDLVRRAVSLTPYGMTVFATASGSADADTTTWVESPKGIPLEHPNLQIVIGPTVERSLLDVLAAPLPGLQDAAGTFASQVDTAASDLMSALGLQTLLGASRDSGGPQAQELDARARGALAALMLAQNDDGSWSWTGRGGASDRYSSARVVWAVSLARKAGYVVAENAFQLAVAFLTREAADLENKDVESRAIVLHALATTGKGDFAVANQLHRERALLSPAALAYLALALVEMDRRSMAEEALAILARRNLEGPASRRVAEQRSLPWSHADAELRALYALAAQAVTPKPPAIREQIDWLLGHRAGYRWAPDKATGPATLALCRWFAQSRFQGERYQLVVLVNDTAVQTLDVDSAAGTRTIDVPAALLAKERQKVQLQLTGRGRCAYQCILSGQAPADKLKSTTADWNVTRTYEPAPREYEGRELPHGFGVVQGRAAVFRNPLGQLPVGRRGLVELVVRRVGVTAATPEDQIEYLVVTEPIPGGTAVIQSSIRGGFDRYEIVSGAIIFYVGKRRIVEPIRYELHGYLPGTYRVAPTVVRDAFRLQDLAVAVPARLTVLPLGGTVTDPYRLSPQELYELGKRHLENGDSETAAPYLTELLEKWNLKPEIYKDVVGKLMDVHLELGPPAKVVQYFEIVKEKWPEQEIPLEKIAKVGAAYHDIGEFERSHLVFRATVEGSFARESRVGEFLNSQDKFLRSVAFMGRLASDYPPEGYVAEAEYSLAQQAVIKAPEASQDPELRANKVNRVDLLWRAWTMLESFLAAWPEDPAADQAAFSAASVLLQLKDYQGAAAACTRYATRYPESELWDHFWYITGYCRFAAGQHKEAIDICRRLAETQRVDNKTGRPADSPNKHRAIFILGQIHHSLGQFAQAVREYGRVADRFSDARLSVEYFLRKAIELPDVASVRPGAPVELDLKFRNLAACDVKVYRIDLMKFSLLKRDLAGITQINLAGIRPLYEATVKLGDGQDYRDRTHKLPLPLAKEGAYLVVARGADLHTSGLVLVTPLSVEVQTDPGSGQVRAMIKDAVADRYLSGVTVKVIGSRMSDFLSGETDLRGVFVAEGITGAPTVIAEAGSGRYAFFRSLPSPGAVAPPLQNVAEKREPSGPAESAGRLVSAPVDMGGGGPVESERRIREALASPTQMRFVEKPFQDVVDFLKYQHRIEIQLDTKALADAGVASDTTVTLTFEGLTLRSALDLLLRDLQLTYAIRDEVLLITTQEQAEDLLTTCVYPVSDLVLVPSASDEIDRADCDFDTLIALIMSTVVPDSWDCVGGPGSIQPEPHTITLVISQTEKVHEQVANVLARLRQSAGTDSGGGVFRVTDSSAGVPLSQTTPTARRINEVLDSPTKLEFAETPLQDVVECLKGQHKIEVQLDTKTLEDSGLSADTPVTRSLQGVTLRSALELMLHELGLTYVVQDEMLLITSQEEAEAQLATMVYPVGDLVAYRDRSGQTFSDFDTLIELISSTIAPDTWDAVGGPSSIEPFPNNLSLVISQTQDVHPQVAGLLDTLRRAGGKELRQGEPPLMSAPEIPEGLGGMGQQPGSFGAMGGRGAGGLGGASGAVRTKRRTSNAGGAASPQHSPGTGQGFGGEFGALQPSASVPGRVARTDSDGTDDLLKGVDDLNRQLNSKQEQRLKARSQRPAQEDGERKGQGSMGGMGGFGGAIKAGGVF